MINRQSLLRLAATVLCAPLVLLTGCPGDDPVAGSAGEPGKTMPAYIAPTLAQARVSDPPKSLGVAAEVAAGPQSGQQAQAADAPQNARVQKLITAAEQSYSSGVKNYQANRLDAARLDFDYAVDTLLASGLDLTGESPLADEFNRLVDAINSLEMTALRQGNGLSPKLEEAPLDTANDLTFAPNPELVAKLRSELNVTSDLPLVINDEVAGYIGVFSSSTSFRAHMAASLRRVGKYRGLIENTLREEGVPQDLIYLAVAESGFQPQAVNGRSGAGGMWQFMARDGAEYGLVRNGFFDYRFDPEKSTRAYAKYIKKLYGLFGDWNLAMAAYDWGPGSMQRAIQRTGYADYWELYRRNAMPSETRAYVPKILAAVIMAKNPERYGLDKLIPSPPVIYDTVQTSYGIDLRLVADVTGASVTEIAALNPALLRMTTPRDLDFDLHIPPGTKALYLERLKDIPEDRRASWRFHIVKPNETVLGIAAALHAKPEEIAETNGITEKDPMAVGDELVVPVAGASAAPATQRYVVHRDETLGEIADHFNVSVDDLRRWNSLSSSKVKPGRSLFVSEPVRLAPSMRGHGRHAGRGRGRTRERGKSGRGSRGSGGRSSAHAKTSAHEISKAKRRRR